MNEDDLSDCNRQLWEAICWWSLGKLLPLTLPVKLVPHTEALCHNMAYLMPTLITTN